MPFELVNLVGKKETMVWHIYYIIAQFKLIWAPLYLGKKNHKRVQKTTAVICNHCLWYRHSKNPCGKKKLEIRHIISKLIQNISENMKMPYERKRKKTKVCHFVVAPLESTHHTSRQKQPCQVARAPLCCRWQAHARHPAPAFQGVPNGRLRASRLPTWS